MRKMNWSTWHERGTKEKSESPTGIENLTSQTPGGCFIPWAIMRVVKGIFVTRDRPFFYPVKCEMAIFFLVNRDFHGSHEAWFCKIIFRATRNKCLVRCEPWFSLSLFFVNCERTVLFSVKRDLEPPLPPSIIDHSWRAGSFNVCCRHLTSFLAGSQ